MKKKLILVLVLIIIIMAYIFTLMYIKRRIETIDKKDDISEKEKIIEDDSFVIVKEPIVLNVYEEDKYSSFIEIKDGELINDNNFDVDKVGVHKKEILYTNIDGEKRKAYIDYEVVDNIAPMVLGGSTITLKKGSDSELNYLYFSADNYDSNPTREIIGDYDLDVTGDYNLTFKVTDSSNNETNKDFTLKVVETIPTYNPTPRKIYYEDIINKHKTSETKIGLDVSRWQGDIDFDKLSTNEVDFVMIRVGFQSDFGGTNEVDSYFHENIKKLNELNIPVGVYFHSYATTIKEVKEQALFVINEIKDYEISLPVSYDFESWSTFPTLELSLHDINELARTFMDTIEDNNYKAMNYGSKYYLENIWDIDEYPVWLANYTDQTEYAEEYVMWQLCNTGIIDGIDGFVDINVLYDLDIISTE